MRPGRFVIRIGLRINVKLPSTFRWKVDGGTLGEGAHGTVVPVVDTTNELQGRYALKTLSGGKSAAVYERFVREASLIKSVAHPHVVQVVDHSKVDDEFPYYVMEYVDGAKSLKQLLRTEGNPFHANPLKSLRMFIQLVAAIQACEKSKIVHRDISPANVLVLPNHDIRLIDFGLCQPENHETITLAGDGVGTQNYMAPECEAGADGQVLSVSDLYSAGKILWSAITNLPAFSREEPAFKSKSMKEVFPDDPMTWHLHHIFAATIRRSIGDRAPNAETALAIAKRVATVIASHYPPLELTTERCPLCGWGSFTQFQGDHMVFGNPNPAGIHAVMCSYCGFCFARSFAQVKKNLDARNTLA